MNARVIMTDNQTGDTKTGPNKALRLAPSETL